VSLEKLFDLQTWLLAFVLALIITAFWLNYNEWKETHECKEFCKATNKDFMFAGCGVCCDCHTYKYEPCDYLVWKYKEKGNDEK